MPMILKIGYQTFLVKRPADAATVVRALAEAVPMRATYQDGKERFFPEERDSRHGEISMKTIARDCLLSVDPNDLVDSDDQTARQHGDRAPLKLLKG